MPLKKQLLRLSPTLEPTSSWCAILRSCASASAAGSAEESAIQSSSQGKSRSASRNGEGGGSLHGAEVQTRANNNVHVQCTDRQRLANKHGTACTCDQAVVGS